MLRGGANLSASHDVVREAAWLPSRLAAFTLAEGATHVAHCDKSRRVAFTLAEVLITLGIIGVVAAITLPTLIQNYQKQVFVNQYKKAYNVLNNGFKQIVAEEGCTSLSCISSNKKNPGGKLINLDFDDEKTINKLTSTFKLSNVQREPKTNSIYGYSMYCLNGVDGDTCGLGNFNESLSLSSDRSFIGITPDGMFFFVSNSWNDNVIVVDVNGLKSPNKLGRDIFSFYYFDYNNSIVVEPNGSMKTMKYEEELYGGEAPSDEELQNLINEDCDPKSSNGLGFSCGEKIIRDGWKMNY